MTDQTSEEPIKEIKMPEEKVDDLIEDIKKLGFEVEKNQGEIRITKK